MRIEHENLFPKILADGMNRSYLIRITCDQHKRISQAKSCIAHHPNGQIYIGLLFLELVNTNITIVKFIATLTTFGNRR